MPAEALVLDANLLVLLIVGTTSEAYISRHKRLRAFTVNDFRLLTARLSAAAQVWVTPNTVTEASNLAGQINEPARKYIFAVFRGLLRKLREIYVPSLHASEQKAFLRLGVTDAGLFTWKLAALDARRSISITTSKLTGRSAERNSHVA